MNVCFFNGVSGMIANQKEMDVLGHNIANVNTAGFKSSRTSFEDLLYTQMDVHEEGHLVGHGTRVSSVDLMYSQGNLLQTNNLLDMAIIGDGFFGVERNGRVEYNRNGAFDVSVEGRKAYLVTSDGGYVLDDRGKRIELERENDETQTLKLDNLVEKVGVYQFDNPFGLTQVDQSSFIESDLSGQPIVYKENDSEKPPYQLKQSALESSNVDLTDQMADLIVTQRAYQVNAKIVQTGDNIEEIINNLRQ